MIQQTNVWNDTNMVIILLKQKNPILNMNIMKKTNLNIYGAGLTCNANDIELHNCHTDVELRHHHTDICHYHRDIE